MSEALRYINPQSLASPRGYSHGLLLPVAPGTRLLFIAGQIGWNQQGRLVDGGFSEQFEQALTNVLSIVTEAGGRPESIGQLTIFVTDRTQYLEEQRQVGEAYRRVMGRHFPAMSLVEVQALVEDDARVEIEGIAVI